MIARGQALAALAEETFDVAVVGGGITGAGVALDAASRGYSVALIERADFASGTSSRSSKLVHGGLRYLQQFDLGLVREALLERQLMVKLAPHLVLPLPIIVAATGGARLDRLVGVGLNLYDVMSVERRRGRRGGGDAWSPDRHRTISGEEVVELLPALAPAEPTAGYLFYDCQTDDVRLVLTVLGEAERFGAVCANRVGALDLLEERGRVAGVRVRDELGGGEFTLRAGHVVNATGVWADALRPSGAAADAVPQIRPSRGTHLIFSDEALPLRAGAIVPAGGGRTIFALPWLGRTLVGTTDNDYEGGLDHVRPPADDVEYLLSAVNGFFGTTLGRGDIAGAYAGVRPLISASADAKSSVDISRKAELYEPADGFVTITGGKRRTSPPHAATRSTTRPSASASRAKPSISVALRAPSHPCSSPITSARRSSTEGSHTSRAARRPRRVRRNSTSPRLPACSERHATTASASRSGRPSTIGSASAACPAATASTAFAP